MRVLGGLSQAYGQSLDPASHPARAFATAGAPPVAGSIVELTTDGIAPSERLSYWREGALRPTVPIKALAEDRPFRGPLRR